jgi:hypothetical protein
MYPDIYKISPTKKTPWIFLEPGKIFIMGRSIPENPGEFYKPVLEWISKYSPECNEKVKIDFGFEYLNTSSTKWIYTIIKEISDMRGMTHNATFTWYYERGDEDMCELGIIMRSIVDCAFVVVEVEGMNKSLYEKIMSGNK